MFFKVYKEFPLLHYLWSSNMMWMFVSAAYLSNPVIIETLFPKESRNPAIKWEMQSWIPWESVAAFTIFSASHLMVPCLSGRNYRRRNFETGCRCRGGRSQSSRIWTRLFCCPQNNFFIFVRSYFSIDHPHPLLCSIYLDKHSHCPFFFLFFFFLPIPFREVPRVLLSLKNRRIKWVI